MQADRLALGSLWLGSRSRRVHGVSLLVGSDAVSGSLRVALSLTRRLAGSQPTQCSESKPGIVFRHKQSRQCHQPRPFKLPRPRS